LQLPHFATVSKGDASATALPRGGGSAFAVAVQGQPPGSGAATPTPATQALALHRQQPQQAGWGVMTRGALDVSPCLGHDQVGGPVLVWLPVSVPPAQLEPTVVHVSALDGVSGGGGAGRNGTYKNGKQLVSEWEIA
jgi:hypothetical protein